MISIRWPQALVICLMLVPGLPYASSPSDSGFFSDAVQFEKHPHRRHAYRFIKQDLDLRLYDKVAIAPVEIWIDSESPYKGMQANSIKTLSDQLRQVMVSTLEPDYPVVKQAGKGTIGVRLAVTGIKMKKKKKSLFSYTPIGMAVAASQDEMLSKTMLSDAIIEAELVDTQTGERIAALVDRHMASELSGSKHDWKEIEEVFEYYAKRFKRSLNESR